MSPLGGGTWVIQNKVLPGAYINFISAANASARLSERGYVAVPIALNWGTQDEIIELSASDFNEHALDLFGYRATSPELSLIRDLFKGAHTAFIFNVASSGTKASNDYATAKYTGTRGNNLTIIIEENVDDSSKFNVSTVLESEVFDTQTVIDATELVDNDWVVFKPGATLALTAGTPLTGGTNGSATESSYQSFLDKSQQYAFNILACPSDSQPIKDLFVSHTRIQRDTYGAKFQLVVHKYETADYEGVISIDNNATAEIVYWIAGKQAGCAVNSSLTNANYDGETPVNTDYTQAQLEAAILAGKFVLHRVDKDIRVLKDINSFTSYTPIKSESFANNQTIRVIDQIGNDIAALFNDRYLGKIPNDNAGRISLWNDITKHHQELQNIRAIQNFSSDDVVVAQGLAPTDVLITDTIHPVSALEKLYMQVIIS